MSLYYCFGEYDGVFISEMPDEVAGDRIVLTRATTDFQDAWAVYQAIEPRYRNANRKLAE